MENGFHILRVSEAWDEGPRLRGLRLAVRETPLAAAFEMPGQYVRARPAGASGEAFLALANAPGEDTFELLIQKADPPDPSRAADRLAMLAVGEPVEVTAPAGKGFPIVGERGRDILLFAGGSGISAIRSVLEHVAAHRNEYGRVILFFGARTVDDLAYRANFEHWTQSRIEVEPTLSRPEEGTWEGRVGYVQAALREATPEAPRCSAFLAGGKDFSNAVTEALLGIGIEPGRIFKNF